MNKYLLFFIFCILVFLINLFYYFPLKYYNEVDQISKKYNIKKEIVFSIIKVESNFNEKAISKKGAIGLMQIMPSTADWVIEEMLEKDKKYNIYEVKDNIEVGVVYYIYLNNKFDSNFINVTAAYNAGESRIKNNKWLEIKETRNYVRKMRIAYFFYKIRLFFK